MKTLEYSFLVVWLGIFFFMASFISLDIDGICVTIVEGGILQMNWYFSSCTRKILKVQQGFKWKHTTFQNP
jgi:hypothetical protein